MADTKALTGQELVAYQWFSALLTAPDIPKNVANYVKEYYLARNTTSDEIGLTRLMVEVFSKDAVAKARIGSDTWMDMTQKTLSAIVFNGIIDLLTEDDAIVDRTQADPDVDGCRNGSISDGFSKKVEARAMETLRDVLDL